ncbi:dUTP diphosphatase [Camelliibacillus cellulosilyticus]|uniref:dUTP diphosphatase n=1 Tax=Camelliibacillus cellulosilyticus TaxID=2174486 RepID=A0ABV9GJG6_9BACL
MQWLSDLYSIQKALNDSIDEKHGLKHSELFNEVTLAFLVELGELANETRCFKFWSLKPPSETAIILEEYVDGIHFLLSLGLDFGYTDVSGLRLAKTQHGNLTKSFLDVFSQTDRFRQTKSEEDFLTLFTIYLGLGADLGFDASQIEEAYMAKNAINYERQRQNY